MCWLRQQQGGPSKGAAVPAASSSYSEEGSAAAARLPDLSDEALVLTAGVWLRPYLSGVRSKADLARLDWQASTIGMDPLLARARVWALVIAVSALRTTV